MAQAIPLALAVAGSAMQAGGTILGADARSDELRSQAGQLDQMAVQDRASSQRTAGEQKRQARLLQSTALARAAASGGGASDPTVMNILANLSGEAEFRALTALYEGEESARSKEMQAQAKRKEAKNAKRAGYVAAAGQILQSGATMYERFG